MIVAIDGPSASGKSTIGRRLARHLGLPLVDSGLMYRAITVMALQAGVDAGDAEGLARLAESAHIEVNSDPRAPRQAWLVKSDGRDLSTRVYDPAITPDLVRISQVGAVRDHLVKLQRRYGEGKGVVMVGRDIGTVVFPDADFKVFLTASEAERRRRRAGQMSVDPGGLIKGEIDDRDAADAGRKLAPLRPAADALTIDTDGRNPDSVFDEVLRLIDQRSDQSAATPPEAR